MKKICNIITLLVIILITLSTSTYAVSFNNNSLNKSIKTINSYLKSNIDSNNPDYLTEIVDENGNVPAYASYPKHIGSRGIGALKQYKGKIFMGLGDWNDNTGPAKILYYDTKDGKIKSSGTIADEAVEIFNIIDNKLYTTGCDPKSNWGYGSYYVYNASTDKWEQNEKKNGWVHIFNIVKFKNKLFMCGSTEGKYTPIQSSSDNGKNFDNIFSYKNSEKLPFDGEIRCYNLFVYNNNLYGFIQSDSDSTTKYNGIYKYNASKNTFNHIADLPNAYNPESYPDFRFSKNTIFNDKFVYVGGRNLYVTTDFEKFSAVTISNTFDSVEDWANSIFSSGSNNNIIQDSLVIDDTLYLLTYKNPSSSTNAQTYSAQIYTTKDLKSFNLFYEFQSETPPFSFEYYKNNFYIGTYIGYGNKRESTKNRYII